MFSVVVAVYQPIILKSLGCAVKDVATDRSLSLTIARIQIRAGACEKVASDLGVKLWFSPGSPELGVI